MAYQFIHLETYSRKGRNGRGVDFVLAEAERRPDACLHVSSPASPETVYGVDLGEVRHLHDDRVATAATALANGKTRAIRRDQNTIVAVVASHPATMESLRSNPDVARAVKDWEGRTVEWLREQYGSALVSVIRHTDERHPHLHAVILPGDPEMRAGRLHPGQESKRLVVAAGPHDGEDGKSLNKRADVAYRAAMRAWQDSYWNACGLPSGLTRLGPGRRRLTREEWRLERIQAQAVQKTQERVDALAEQKNSFISKTRVEASALMEAAKAEADTMRAKAIEQASAAKHLHDAAEAKERKASSILARAHQQGKHFLESARKESDRLRSIGTRIRFLWDGLRRSAIESRLRQSIAADVTRERQRADEAGRRAIEESRKRRDAEQAREHAIAAVHAVGRERDAARRQLSALMPDAATHQFMQPGPRGTP